MDHNSNLADYQTTPSWESIRVKYDIPTPLLGAQRWTFRANVSGTKEKTLLRPVNWHAEWLQTKQGLFEHCKQDRMTV